MWYAWKLQVQVHSIVLTALTGCGPPVSMQPRCGRGLGKLVELFTAEIP